jgi:exonuclease III
VFNENDIILFTESWTNSFSELHVSGFEHYVLNRTETKKNSKRSSGGIIIYVRNKFVSNETLVFQSNDDIICVKIKGSQLSLTHDLFVCLCYVIPDDSSRQSMIDSNVFDRLLDYIASLYSTLVNDFELLICGDMNARTSDNPDYVTDDNFKYMTMLPDDYVIDTVMERHSQDKGHTNNNGILLLDFCKQTGLRIFNGRVGSDKGMGRYTFVGHRGSSLVDYVIGTQNLLKSVKRFDVSEPNILSDHCLINFVLEFDNPINVDISDSHDHVSYKYLWSGNLKSVYTDELLSERSRQKFNCLNVQINSAVDMHDINECVDSFSNILDEVASPLFKRNIGVNNKDNAVYSDQPWFTEDCHEKRIIFNRMLNRFRLNKSEENRISLVNARSQYKTCIRKCRYDFDKAESLKLTQAKFNNAKLYWNMLKGTAGVKQSNVQLDTFAQYFKSVNNPDDPFYTPDEDVIYFIERYEREEFNVLFDELNVQISDLEITKAIKQLKSGKSGGPDAFLNEFFIHGRQMLMPSLLILFNKIFQTGYFPESWSEGFVIPLHKKGSLNDVNNFRGITLLNVLGKLFTRILNNRLSNWAEEYSVYIEAQAGFRSHMGTVDNIFVLHGLISHMINNGRQLYCAFIDFTKAFDYIVRDNLWFKMIKLGIRGHILNIIRSMYSSVKARVKFCNELSDEYVCSLGVRQGECLSPFLFSMFLNDLEDSFINSDVPGIDVNMFKVFLILYADDIVVFANTKDELQTSLNIISAYCDRWKLSVNPTKTKVMIFRRGGRVPENCNFMYKGSIIEIVSKFTYLGIVFTTGGSFAEAQKTIAGQAMKAIFQMNKYLYRFINITVVHRLELFDKLISPILNYGSEVWGFVTGNNIERVHMQFCKSILGVKKSTQNDFVYGELGRVSFQVLRHYNVLKYWIKIIHTKSNKYVYKVYNLLKTDFENHPNKANWCSLVKSLLCSLGFHDAWLMQSVGNIDMFLFVVKQRLRDHFVQNWSSRLQDSSRALFYRQISCFKLQPYLSLVNVKKYYCELARLRVSSHRLHIETGRWTKPNSTPINERICYACGILEDEFHFILECNVYAELRQRFIPSYYWRRPNMQKLLELLNTDKEKLTRKLANFVSRAFQIRREIIYSS